MLPISLICLSLLDLVSTLRLPYENPQHLLSEPQDVQDGALHYPTVHESAVMARRILHLTSIGTLVTAFPKAKHSAEDSTSTLENRPVEVEGSPIGLMEYFADCEPSDGNPTLLALNIATPFRNYGAGSNISLSMRWWPLQTNHYSSWFDEDEIPTPHTPAALPRFSLHGRLEPIAESELVKHGVPACFMQKHPDSVLWQPGNDIHESQYVRLIVEHVYWFGGFGDRARIGWLPIEEYRGVTAQEIAECRLPGEKKTDSDWWRRFL
jgi:hypothetical protein